jgi:glycosyltransferase involved in cell wall biosynthesis
MSTEREIYSQHVPCHVENSSSTAIQSLRVLHCMPTNFGMTGVETFILQLCAAQKRLGLNPQVTIELAHRTEFAERAADIQVPVLDLSEPGRVKTNLPRKIGSAMLRARRMKTFADQMRCADVLHIHSVGFAGFDQLFAAYASGMRRTVVTYHTTLGLYRPTRTRTTDFGLWVQKKVAARVIAPYATAADELVTEGFRRESVAVVPFCVDEALFSGTVDAPEAGRLTLIMAARLYEGKGHRELLLAVAKLLPRFPGLRLILIGDGPEQAHIESEIHRLNLAPVVQVKGRIDHGEMPTQLLQGHVVVLPSYMPGETFPISLLEGMALGLPAIGSRWYGIPDIIADGETGIVVEPRDVEGLASAIERFLTDRDYYSAASRKAKKRARERFTATAVADTYSGIYLQTAKVNGT